MIDPNWLRQVIEGGETFTVEFKSEERSPLSDHDLVEAVVCLANGQGGVLLLGVEDDGQGIDLIFDGQLRTGHRPPDYGRSDETGVTVVLAGGAADPAFARFVIEQGRAGKPLTLDDLLILHALQEEEPVDLKRVTGLLQKSSAEALAQLERLIRFGWLEARGKGEKRQYRLAGPARMALGLAAVSAGPAEFEPARWEALVEQYVGTHGKITRAEAAEICGISPSQAYRLLRRLADGGILRQVGSGRGAYYEKTHGAGP